MLVTDWHAFAPGSPHSDNGKTYAVVNKGPDVNQPCCLHRQMCPGLRFLEKVSSC
jgi:hypothetical protein